MTRDRFAEILKEYGYSNNQIEMIWDTRQSDDLDEEKLRLAAARTAPIKDELIQA